MSLSGDPGDTPDVVSSSGPESDTDSPAYRTPRPSPQGTILALRTPHPTPTPTPVHREKAEEALWLKALRPRVTVLLLLFCAPGSPVSTLYLNYLSFL